MPDHQQHPAQTSTWMAAQGDGAQRTSTSLIIAIRPPRRPFVQPSWEILSATIDQSDWTVGGDISQTEPQVTSEGSQRRQHKYFRSELCSATGSSAALAAPVDGRETRRTGRLPNPVFPLISCRGSGARAATLAVHGRHLHPRLRHPSERRFEPRLSDVWPLPPPLQ